MSQSAEDWIRQRASVASQLREPAVDVTERVLNTVGQRVSSLPAIDKTPLLVGGGLLALAASIMLVLLPSTTLITEPWISFWLI
ncbi:MAG: hypothetical protein KDB22_24540 [Planctomycetales bacterium]|nr:hypothetical protein [Planctomycetales bacterium]